MKLRKKEVAALVAVSENAMSLPETVKYTDSEPSLLAEATASAIFLARTGSSKAEIKAYTEENFGYNLNRTCDEIRPGYHHVETSISFQRQV